MLSAGVGCFWSCTWLKRTCGYDDSLDVFGVHGIGGATGTFLVGIFAVPGVGGAAGLLYGNGSQVITQLYGMAVTLVWSGGATLIILKAIACFVPLRVDHRSEIEGLDVTQHGEALQ